jgi:uncharacterized protein (TIGR02118 family)
MQKLLVFYGEPADPAEFERYYREHHLPLARKLPGLISAEFMLDIKGLGNDFPYWAMFEAVFESEAAMQTALDSEAGKAVGDDVINYASGGATLSTASVNPL